MKLLLESNLVNEDQNNTALNNNYNTDLELLIYAMTLINKTLAGIPDQDTYYDFVDPLEELGMENVIKSAFGNKSQQSHYAAGNAATAKAGGATGDQLQQLLTQFKTYEQVLRLEDGEESCQLKGPLATKLQTGELLVPLLDSNNKSYNSSGKQQQQQVSPQAQQRQLSATATEKSRQQCAMQISPRNRSKSIVNLLIVKNDDADDADIGRQQQQHHQDDDAWDDTNSNNNNNNNNKADADLFGASRRKSRRHSAILSPNCQQQQQQQQFSTCSSQLVADASLSSPVQGGEIAIKWAQKRQERTQNFICLDGQTTTNATNCSVTKQRNMSKSNVDINSDDNNNNNDGNRCSANGANSGGDAGASNTGDNQQQQQQQQQQTNSGATTNITIKAKKATQNVIQANDDKNSQQDNCQSRQQKLGNSNANIRIIRCNTVSRAVAHQKPTKTKDDNNNDCDTTTTTTTHRNLASSTQPLSSSDHKSSSSKQQIDSTGEEEDDEEDEDEEEVDVDVDDDGAVNNQSASETSNKCPGHKQILHTQIARGLHQRASISSCSSSDSYASHGYVSESGNSTDTAHQPGGITTLNSISGSSASGKQQQPISVVARNNFMSGRQQQQVLGAPGTCLSSANDGDGQTVKKHFGTYKIKHRIIGQQQQQTAAQQPRDETIINDDDDHSSSSAKRFLAELDQLTEQLTQHHTTGAGRANNNPNQLPCDTNDDDRIHYGGRCHDNDHGGANGDDDDNDDHANIYVDDEDDDDDDDNDDDVGDDQDDARVAAMLKRQRRQYEKNHGGLITSDDLNSRSATIKSCSSTMSTSSRLTTSSGVSTSSSSPSASISSGHFNSLDMHQQQHQQDSNDCAYVANSNNQNDNSSIAAAAAAATTAATTTTQAQQDSSTAWMKPTMMQQRQPSIIVRTNSHHNQSGSSCVDLSSPMNKTSCAPVVTSTTAATTVLTNGAIDGLQRAPQSKQQQQQQQQSTLATGQADDSQANSSATVNNNCQTINQPSGNSKSVKSIQERLFSNSNNAAGNGQHQQQASQTGAGQKSLQSVLINQINAGKLQQQATNNCHRLPPRPASSNAIIGGSSVHSSSSSSQHYTTVQQLQQHQQSAQHNHLFKWENLMQKGVTRPLLINDLDFTDLHDDDDDNILNQQQQQQQQQQPKALHTSSTLSIDSQDSFDSGTGSGASPNLNQRSSTVASAAPPPLPPPPMSSMSWFNTIGGFSSAGSKNSFTSSHKVQPQQLSPSPPYDNTDTMSLSSRLPATPASVCSTPVPVPPPSPPPPCDGIYANGRYNAYNRNSVCLYNTMATGSAHNNNQPSGNNNNNNNNNNSGGGSVMSALGVGGMRSASSMSSLYFSNSTNSLTLSKYGNKSKKTMKLFWKEVKEDKSLLARLTKRRGTIWDEIKPAPIDTVKLEQLFESKAKDLLLLSKGRGQDGLGGVKKIEITVLDAKRSNAINIGMTKLPPMRTIKSAILKMDSTIMNREGIEKILTTMMPTEEEKSRIIEAQLANPDTPLGTAEQFLLNLASISALEARLKLWAFQLDYATIEKEVAEPLMDLKQAIEEIEKSETFRIVLGTLLAIGNFLNSSDAKGFQIDYLSKVPEVKDTVHKHSLLHHLCQFIQEKYPQANQTSDLYSEFGAVNRASKIDFNEVAKSLQKMQSDCKVSWDYLKIVAKHDGLASMMNGGSSSANGAISTNATGGQQSAAAVGLVTTTAVLPVSSRSSRGSTDSNCGSGSDGGLGGQANSSQQVQTKTTKISDFLTDCAERIMVLMVIHRRVINRFNKLLVYLGCPSGQIKQTQPQQILKIINEFALEYRTKRERVLEMMQKKQNFKERNKTRGKLILNSDHYLMLQQQQAKQQQQQQQQQQQRHHQHQMNSDKLQPSISMINLATTPANSSSTNNSGSLYIPTTTTAAAAATTTMTSNNNAQQQLHRYSSHSPVNSSEQLKRDEQLRQLLGSRDSIDEGGHWSSTMTNTAKLIRSRHNQHMMTNGSRQNSTCHQEETEDEEEELSTHQSSYYRHLNQPNRHQQSQQQQQQQQRCGSIQRGHGASNDDEILDSLVQTATAKCARGEAKNRQRSKLSRFGCERKSLRRTLKNGLEVDTNGQ